MPNVLQLISSSGFYGADNVLIELSRELEKSTFRPFVGVFKNSQNPHLEIATVAAQHSLPVITFPCNGKLDLRTVITLRKYLKANAIDIVHTHGYKTNFYALAALVGKRMACVTTCHNWLGGDAKMKFYAALDKRLLNRFDRIVAVSDRVQEEILNHHIASEKALMINNGIDIKRFHTHTGKALIKQKLGIDPDAMVIGTVGRLSDEKGHVNLLEAAIHVIERYPKVVFLIVGDGPLRKQLEAKATEITDRISEKTGFSHPHFIFTGVRNDMPDIYSIMDIFTLPSFEEGLPMVILETMASKTPIISTRVGAIPSVLEDGRSGLFVTPGDVTGLAAAIVDLLENEEKRDTLSKNAWQRVEREFSSRKMAEKYIAVYEDALRTRKIKK